MSTTEVHPTLDANILRAKAHRLLSGVSFDKETGAKCEALIRLADSLDGTAKALRDARIAEMDRELGIRGKFTNQDPAIEASFREFLRLGKDGIDPELRALAAGTDASGGFITPASFAAQFTESLQQTDELFEISTLIETEKGTAAGFPIDDSTAKATLVAENAQSATNSPVVFDNVAFGRCPQWRSGHIVASMELVQDCAFDFAGLLAREFGRRFARGVGEAFITTLISDADVSITTATALAVTGGELLDLVGSVDPAYGKTGGFMLNATTWTAIQKANLASSGYSWTSRDATGRKLLFGFPVFESPSLANLGASNVSIAFGDFSRFVGRQVRNSLRVRVYHELYATSAQIAYEGFLRVDGKLSKATHKPLPVRLLKCHS